MTIETLIEILSGFDPKLIVLHSSDEEGNRITDRPVVGRSFFIKYNDGEVNLLHPEDFDEHSSDDIQQGVVFYG